MHGTGRWRTQYDQNVYTPIAFSLSYKCFCVAGSHFYNFNVEKDAYLSEKLTIESKKVSFQNIKFAIESQNYNEPTKKHIKNI